MDISGFQIAAPRPLAVPGHRPANKFPRLFAQTVCSSAITSPIPVQGSHFFLYERGGLHAETENHQFGIGIRPSSCWLRHRRRRREGERKTESARSGRRRASPGSNGRKGPRQHLRGDRSRELRRVCRADFHGDLMAESSAGAREKARAFVHEYSRMLGLGGEVTLVGERVDKLGKRHLTFEQSYRGVPVFAGMVRAHFEGDGRLVAVNGNLVPGIRVNPNPTRSASEAAAMAIALVSGENEGPRGLRALGHSDGLPDGPRPGHRRRELPDLADRGRQRRRRPRVRLRGRPHRQGRRPDHRHHGRAATAGPTSTTAELPGHALLGGGPGLPDRPTPKRTTCITASGETYNFYSNAFGRDSFDGAGAHHGRVFRRTQTLPERVLERHLHLVLRGRHARRRRRPRVDATPTPNTRTASSTPGSPAP